jgi:hypothetical protein
MKTSLIALGLLVTVGVAACGGSAPESGNRAAPEGNAAVTQGQQDGERRGGETGEAASTRLTGLYEGGSGAQRNQLCIVDKGSGSAQFGLIVWGANMHSCAGAGTAARKGDRLTLTMAGDSACTIDATMEGGTVRLPETVPAGCSYYCGAQASLAGTFERTGSTADDAKKAKDLAGDPLCEGNGG